MDWPPLYYIRTYLNLWYRLKMTDLHYSTYITESVILKWFGLTSTTLHMYISQSVMPPPSEKDWPPLHYIHIWVCDASTVWKGLTSTTSHTYLSLWCLHRLKKTDLHYITYISESVTPLLSEKELTSTMLHTYLSLWCLHRLKRN